MMIDAMTRQQKFLMAYLATTADIHAPLAYQKEFIQHYRDQVS